MKVILLKDVAKMGRKGSVVEVPDGFALNQLIPKKLAEAATATNLKKIQNTITTAAHQSQTEDQKYLAAVAALQADRLKISADSNAKGHLFKAIHEVDIESAAKVKNIALANGVVSIETPIKSLGEHEIILKRGAMKHVCIIEIIKKV